MPHLPRLRPSILCLALLAASPIPASAKRPGTPRSKGLVICETKNGLTFFRRGECPSFFFMNRSPDYNEVVGLDGITRRPDFCIVRNLLPGYQRESIPQKSCYNPDCDAICMRGEEDHNLDGTCDPEDCIPECWDSNKNFRCDSPSEDTDGDQACTKKDCIPECWDRNGDFDCDIPIEDRNKDSSCDSKDCVTECWDANHNFQCDLPAEDTNNDHLCTIADCIASIQCWDLNGNGACDALLEDTNVDKVCNVLDCLVRSSLRSAGREGPITPVEDPQGRATLRFVLPATYDVSATFHLRNISPGEVVRCRLLDGDSFEKAKRLGDEVALLVDGDVELMGLGVRVDSLTVALRCASSLPNSTVLLERHSIKGLRLIVDRVESER